MHLKKITLYNLNIYNFCQLYLSKPGEKIFLKQLMLEWQIQIKAANKSEKWKDKTGKQPKVTKGKAGWKAAKNRKNR